MPTPEPTAEELLAVALQDLAEVGCPNPCPRPTFDCDDTDTTECWRLALRARALELRADDPTPPRPEEG